MISYQHYQRLMFCIWFILNSVVVATFQDNQVTTYLWATLPVVDKSWKNVRPVRIRNIPGLKRRQCVCAFVCAFVVVCVWLRVWPHTVDTWESDQALVWCTLTLTHAVTSNSKSLCVCVRACLCVSQHKWLSDFAQTVGGNCSVWHQPCTEVSGSFYDKHMVTNH